MLVGVLSASLMLVLFNCSNKGSESAPGPGPGGTGGTSGSGGGGGGGGGACQNQTLAVTCDASTSFDFWPKANEGRECNVTPSASCAGDDVVVSCSGYLNNEQTCGFVESCTLPCPATCIGSEDYDLLNSTGAQVIAKMCGAGGTGGQGGAGGSGGQGG